MSVLSSNAWVIDYQFGRVHAYKEKCPWCGRTFEATLLGSAYCSKKCRKAVEGF